MPFAVDPLASAHQQANCALHPHPAGNACYVCLTKASDKCEAEIQEIVEERSALKGVTGAARRKRVYSRVGADGRLWRRCSGWCHRAHAAGAPPA